MRQHNNMVCVRALCLERYAGLQSGIPLQTERTYTHRIVMLPHHHTIFLHFNKF